MKRRTFFKSLGSNLVLVLLPRWGRAQTASVDQPISYPAISDHNIVVVVLPESLGPRRAAETVAASETWPESYKEGPQSDTVLSL